MMKTVKASLLPMAILIHIGMRLMMTDTYLDTYEQQGLGIDLAIEMPAEVMQTAPSLYSATFGQRDEIVVENDPLACLH